MTTDQPISSPYVAARALQIVPRMAVSVLGRHRPCPDRTGPIGSAIDAIRGTLDPWLGRSRRGQRSGNRHTGVSLRVRDRSRATDAAEDEINRASIFRCWVGSV